MGIAWIAVLILIPVIEARGVGAPGDCALTMLLVEAARVRLRELEFGLDLDWHVPGESGDTDGDAGAVG